MSTPPRALSSPMPAPVSRRTFAIGFTFFLLALGGFFWGMMRVVAPKLDRMQTERPEFYELSGVIRGDTLLVLPNLGGKRDRDQQAPIPVKIRGYTAPPTEPGPEADAFAAAVGCPPSEVPQLGRVARNAIQGWIYKQSNLMLDYDREHPEYDHEGRLVARAEIGHVDIGRIQLREGQGITDGLDHPLRPIYLAAEAEAKAARAGVWRWQK